LKAIELGGGSSPQYHPNVDVRPNPSVDIVADFNKLPLPLPDDEYELVYSKYCMEHISWRVVADFIKEMYRICAPGGRVQVITANLEAQAKFIVEHPERWELDGSPQGGHACMVFGDLDYPENSHKSGFSPAYAKLLFERAGFTDVKVTPVGEFQTDMLIEAAKPMKKAMAEIFGRAYFEGKAYTGEGYRDFGVHHKTARMVLDRKPESVLEVGGARGYICKLIKNSGVKATCLEVSEHCWHTRAVEDFIKWDMTETPWPIPDKSFDLCFSIATMEHLPTDRLDGVIREMARVSRRGLHGITYEITPQDVDETHKHGTIKPLDWWRAKFKEVAPDYPVEILDKEEMERGPVEVPGPDGLVKLNIGSFTTMFYYGWINIDTIDLKQWAQANGYIFEQMDVRQSLPRAPDTVDLIYASHFIEHLTGDEALKFLQDCWRMLKPGGVIRLTVPDAYLIAQKYVNHEIMEYRHVNVGVEKAEDEAEAFYRLLMEGHKLTWDGPSLVSFLKGIGYEDVEVMSPWTSKSPVMLAQTLPMYPTLSCYVEAVKPAVRGETLNLKIPEVITELPKLLHGFSWTDSVETGVLSVVRPTVAPAIAAGVRKTSLKVALISTPFLRTPPDHYGGLELIVANLAQTLAKMGHDVTVFAANGSKVPNCKVVEFGEPLMKVNVDWAAAERAAFEVYRDRLKEFDIIHGHNWLGYEYLAKALDPSLKVIHTHHGGLNAQFWKQNPPFKLNLVAISKWMAKVYAAQGFTAEPVYNGIDLSRYVYQEQKGNRLIYVGRIDKFKQPHVAIEVAKNLNMPIDLVGGTFVQDQGYLEEIKGKADGQNVVLYLDATHEKKVELLKNAAALIFPSMMGEPFGLVPVEAMATGTPVFALNDGAVEEVVRDGGVVVDVFKKLITPGQMTPVTYGLQRDPVKALTDALSARPWPSPEKCRRNAEMFTQEKMAEDYLRLYNEILDGKEW